MRANKDKTPKELLIKNYEIAINAIAEAFLNKQQENDEPPVNIRDDRDIWWTSINKVGGCLCVFGETFYDLDDMLTDLMEDAPVGELDRYNAYVLRCTELGLEKRCNYRSWLHGCPRYSEETLAHLECLKQELSDEVERLNGKEI